METRSSLSRSLHTNRGLEKLEPYEGKLSCTVLRGEEGSNALDLPDRPSDLAQRDGRGVRAGNEIAKLYADNKVDVIIYAVEKSLDSYKFNLLHCKQTFISQLKSGALGARTIDEGAMDEKSGMNFSEYMAILSGNTDLLDKAKMEKKIASLEGERKSFNKGKRDSETKLQSKTAELGNNKASLKGMTEDYGKFMGKAKKDKDGNILNLITLDGVESTNLEVIGKHLQMLAEKGTTGGQYKRIGEIYGFPVKIVSETSFENGIAKREQQIKAIENRNPYYYICMLSSLIPVFLIMFILVKKFAARMRKSQADMEQLIAELQEANRQNQELLRSRRKTLLTIVHELRSPLSAISSESAQMLRERDHVSCERMTGIYQSSKMMSEMIDGLLTFYRLDSGKETLFKKPVNLKSISEMLRLEYSAQATQAGLTLTVHAHAEGVVIADKLKLLRIGRNLLSNAIKYSSSGDVILITEYINGIYTMSVHDNGTGMSIEQTAEIFKAFHRLGNAATKDGFGLGLSIVDSIVKLMKGTVSVESEKGKGSIFTVKLPMERADSPQNVTDCYQGIDTASNYRIIAIDDSEAQLEIIHEAFSVAGMSCDTCRNVNDLMLKMRENEYDLLITDLKMPEYDGYAVLELLRASNIRNSRSIPVLILTASDNITEEEFISAGFCGCVFKPVSFKELREKVEGYIETVTKEHKMDFSRLMAYGNKNKLLETIVGETKEELVSIKATASKEDRVKMQNIVHHLYSSWSIISADGPLRELSRLLKNTSATDEEINMAVYVVIRQAETIINEATTQLENNV